MPMRPASRRSFLAAAATLGSAGLLPRQCLARGLAAPLGIQIYSLRGFPVDEALEHAKNLGFTAVEFYPGMFPITDDPTAIQAMLEKVKNLGLTISGHGVNAFGGNAEANRRIFAFAKAAGIRTITANPADEAFASLDELVKEFDIRIAIHNHGPGHRYNRVIDVLQAIEKHDERIGACADLGHFIRSGERPTEVIRVLKGRLYGVHLKDFAEMREKTKGVILGEGHLHVPAVFEALEQAGFPADGALSLEYEENPKDPLADIRACVAVAKAALNGG